MKKQGHWRYDSNSPQRDTSVPVEVEAFVGYLDGRVTWRDRARRLWRLLVRAS